MDTVSKTRRSAIMASVRSSGNKSTELRFITFMKSHGIKGWRRRFTMEGKPDFVFPKSRLAVFIDGCMWHGCPTHCRIPHTNRSYWVSKIEGNRTRDRKVTRTLRKSGWCVIRVWEHEVSERVVEKKIKRIKKVLQQSRPVHEETAQGVSHE